MSVSSAELELMGLMRSHRQPSDSDAWAPHEGKRLQEPEDLGKEIQGFERASQRPAKLK